MADNQTEKTVSLSNKKRINDYRRSVLCTLCYQYFGSYLHKHTCKVVGRRLTPEERARCFENTDKGNKNIVRFLYYNPDSAHFPSQDTFSRAEVFQLLGNLGHRPIPQEFRDSQLHFGLPEWVPLCDSSVSPTTQTPISVASSFGSVNSTGAQCQTRVHAGNSTTSSETGAQSNSSALPQFSENSSVSSGALGSSVASSVSSGKKSVVSSSSVACSASTGSLGKTSVAPSSSVCSSVLSGALGKTSVAPSNSVCSSVLPGALGKTSIAPSSSVCSSVLSGALGKTSVAPSSSVCSSVLPGALGKTSVVSTTPDSPDNADTTDVVEADISYDQDISDSFSSTLSDLYPLDVSISKLRALYKGSSVPVQRHRIVLRERPILTLDMHSFVDLGFRVDEVISDDEFLTSGRVCLGSNTLSGYLDRNHVDIQSSLMDASICTSPTTSTLLEPRPKRRKVKPPIVEDFGTSDDSDQDMDYDPCIDSDVSDFEDVEDAEEAGSSQQPLQPRSGRINWQMDSVKAGADQAGFYDVTAYDHIQMFDDFFKYMTTVLSKPTKYASQVVAHAKRLMRFVNGGHESDITTCELSALIINSVLDFQEYLKTLNMKNATIRTYLQDAYLFIDWLIVASDDPAEKSRLTTVNEGVKFVLSGASKRAKQDAREEKIKNFQQAPSPQEASTVVRTAADVADQYLTHLLKTSSLDSGKLAYVNGYIAAYICLQHAHFPGLAENLRLSDFQAAELADREGSSVYVVRSSTKAFPGSFALSSSMFRFFQRYSELRAKILLKTDDPEKTPKFLVNSLGGAVSKLPQLISRLHKKCKLSKVYTNRDARLAFECWCLNMNTTSSAYFREMATQGKYAMCKQYTFADCAAMLDQCLNVYKIRSNYLMLRGLRHITRRPPYAEI